MKFKDLFKSKARREAEAQAAAEEARRQSIKVALVNSIEEFEEKLFVLGLTRQKTTLVNVKEAIKNPNFVLTPEREKDLVECMNYIKEHMHAGEAVAKKIKRLDDIVNDRALPLSAEEKELDRLDTKTHEFTAEYKLKSKELTRIRKEMERLEDLANPEDKMDYNNLQQVESELIDDLTHLEFLIQGKYIRRTGAHTARNIEDKIHESAEDTEKGQVFDPEGLVEGLVAAGEADKQYAEDLAQIMQANNEYTHSVQRAPRETFEEACTRRRREKMAMESEEEAEADIDLSEYPKKSN